MAKPKHDKSEPDVKVHHKNGCELDGRKDQHTHTQAAHRAHLDAVGERMRAEGRL